MDNRATTMCERLKCLDSACDFNEPEEVAKHLIPIRQLGVDELAYTHFAEVPEHEAIYQLPMVTPDGKPVGGGGKVFARVQIYNDGTAIAIIRCWKYDYHYPHENKMCLDGKPVQSPRIGANEMIVRFYLLGCKHDYREGGNEEAHERGLHLFRCDHLHICNNCGHFYVVDSSD